MNPARITAKSASSDTKDVNPLGPLARTVAPSILLPSAYLHWAWFKNMLPTPEMRL